VMCIFGGPHLRVGFSATMTPQRRQLKARLWRECTDWSLEPPRPRCVVCGKPLPQSGACDMHEVIVSKKVAMGWPKEQRGLINHKYNCVLVHTGGGTGCHKEAHAHPDKLVAWLISRYGWYTIDDWVHSLPFKVPFAWHQGIRTGRQAREILTEAKS